MIGPVARFTGAVDTSIAAASPGQHSIHYAPRAPAYRFDPADVSAALAFLSRHAPGAAALLTLSESVPSPLAPAGHVRQMPAAPAAYAKALYATLREVDADPVESILIEMPPEAPEWLAVRDRLTRATRPLPP